jgi:hypothetical protein
LLAVFVPPFDPLHPQVQGPVPENEATVPGEHRLELLALRDATVSPFADPHAPFTAAGTDMVVLALLGDDMFPLASLAQA